MTKCRSCNSTLNGSIAGVTFPGRQDLAILTFEGWLQGVSARMINDTSSTMDTDGTVSTSASVMTVKRAYIYSKLIGHLDFHRAKDYFLAHSHLYSTL